MRVTDVEELAERIVRRASLRQFARDLAAAAAISLIVVAGLFSLAAVLIHASIGVIR